MTAHGATSYDASAPPRAATPDMVPRPFRVRRSRHDTSDTRTLVLEPVDGAPLVFAPGQFTMLLVPGVGEVPLSISGDPAQPEVLVHTVRDVGPVSRAVVAAQRGDVLGVRGPFGVGWQVADGRGGDVVVVAGGIGIAPLRPALLQVAADRSAYGRVALLHGARTPEDVLYADDERAWSEEHDIDVEVVVDRGTYGWRGRVGLVTALLDRVRLEPGAALALVCGPEVMMRHAARALVGRGVPADRVRLSMERNMRCGTGLCGHCQLREVICCVDGPVLGWDRLEPLMSTAEL